MDGKNEHFWTNPNCICNDESSWCTTGRRNPGPVAEEAEEFGWVDQLLYLTVLIGFSLILEID
jgi:hypothetical protein